jgi:1-acyl-sn-glycerol-3-phosphate acyltransferase
LRSLSLLASRRFGALFWVQFLGAFNDNVFKQALILLFAVAYPSQVGTLSNVATGLLIVPFFLFSATAGQVADKMEKSRLVKGVKLLEVFIMVTAFFVLPSLSIVGLLLLLFLSGLQSSVFGPVKYSILPQVLRDDELVLGNGLIEMGTYLAVLGGTILGGVLAGLDGAVTFVGASVVVLALVGLASATAMPRVESPSPDLKVSWNVFGATWRMLTFATEERAVWLSILGNSWFWGVGTLFLAQIPGFVTDVLGADESVITVLLIAFSVGIGVGSILCDRLSRGQVELGLVPFGSIGISLFAVDLFFATAWLTPAAGDIVPSTLFVRDGAVQWWNVRWMADLVLLGVFGGFYSVPLNAIIQDRAAPEKRSRIIAANNVINALFMVGATVLALGGLSIGLSIPTLFLVAGVANVAVAVYIYTLLPEFLLRFLAWLLISTMYRLDDRGTERIPREGPAILTSNHVTYVDAIILLAASPRPIRFLMWYRIFQIPGLSWIFKMARAIPVASHREVPGMAAKALDEAARALENGELVGIFPEGGLTYNGELKPFRPGIVRMVERTPVPVVPMALQGMWGSWFSRRGGPAMAKRPRRFWSRVGLQVGEPLAPEEVTVEKLTEITRELRGGHE